MDGNVFFQPQPQSLPELRSAQRYGNSFRAYLNVYFGEQLPSANLSSLGASHYHASEYGLCAAFEQRRGSHADGCLNVVGELCSSSPDALYRRISLEVPVGIERVPPAERPQYASFPAELKGVLRTSPGEEEEDAPLNDPLNARPPNH